MLVSKLWYVQLILKKKSVQCVSVQTSAIEWTRVSDTTRQDNIIYYPGLQSSAVFEAVLNRIPPIRAPLHLITIHYNALYHTILHSATPQYTAPHYITPNHFTPHHTKLHYTTIHCTAIHHTAPHHTTLLYTTSVAGGPLDMGCAPPPPPLISWFLFLWSITHPQSQNCGVNFLRI